MVKKVLIVDDEKLARDRILRFLTELGYQFDVTEADSGLSALERINESQPDILFLDIQMPGLSGLEFLQQVEHRPPSRLFFRLRMTSMPFRRSMKTHLTIC